MPGVASSDRPLRINTHELGALKVPMADVCLIHCLLWNLAALAK